MRQLSYSRRFRKSLKKLVKSGSFDSLEFKKILTTLQQGGQLDIKYGNHKLSGVFEGCEECHIKNDLLLIYHINQPSNLLTVIDVGSHSELFE